MDTDNILVFMIPITILLFLAICLFANYECNVIKYQNFQTTIKDLSPEQKCIHICGFQWESYLENYKFCLEKCDRISERTLSSD